ncbi:ATP-binding protein [Bdellovibrio sp. SKB1291214]|uniref:PAS domain-containing hybrid sensor histidine kinase/response regulator n=1 Tax=Bdellovibrio sp. SKB1291214 TaxID=1732569 RepID=UPI000B5195D0|nr:ATP-binding protein [Bdellovibrio sp. SKB1291214]UYL07707.1 ATP-binding protein [Bdellovibrio sp. SKB1291214]
MDVVNKALNKEQAQALQNESFEVLVQSVQDYAIFALDRFGYVSTWNAGAERIKGYKADEILGKHFSTFYRQEDIDRGHPSHELEVAEATGRFEEEGQRLRKDGSLFWANVVITALFDKDKNLTGFLKVTRDITDRKNAEEALKKLNAELELRVLERTSQLQLREKELKFAKDQAERANAAKSTFLANMSHEIRTPLGAILGFTDMIVEDNISGEDRETAKEAIQRNGQLLMNLINDILDLAKIEASKLELEKESVNLASLKQELISTFQSPAKIKGVELTVEFHPNLPANIISDNVRLRQILYNLIGNAVKFTNRGKVKIFARPRGGSHMAISVEDQGIGISEDQQSTLFQPFQQADPSITRSFGGTGLGLVLSRNLAQALGGDLDLTESELGKGSTFTLTLPIVEDFDFSVKEEQDVILSAPDSVRIMVVDDNADNRRLLSITLRKQNYIVESAADGLECLEKVPVFKPDIIFMDLQMPRMDGISTTLELKKRNFRMPVVALTANALKEEREKCLGLGFAEYLTKPINRTLIEQAVVRNLADSTVRK